MTIDTKHIDVAETAKLVRAALKEAFPEVKFSVRSSRYSMGASVHVGWTDGPLTRQVEAVAHAFQGSHYDGMTDRHGGCVHAFRGEHVRFGADSISCSRSTSDAAFAAALAKLEPLGFDKAVELVDEVCSFPPHGSARGWCVSIRELVHLYLRNAPVPEFDGRKSKLATEATLVRTY